MEKSIESKAPKLWNKNFFLLWQGQFVSSIGDVFFEIALGFWVLAVTGSTALMGTLMAASTIPRVIISPFSGVFVDRANRRNLIVIMDMIRGIAVVFIAVAAFTGFLEIWMVFAVGILIGICAAFFDPSVGSVIPDICPPETLLQANSAFGMIRSFSGILGNSVGGVIYAFLGAPLMFLVNGVSYIFSSISEMFISVPKVVHQEQNFHYLDDLKDGFRFIGNNTAIKLIAINAGVLNFFLVMGGILFLPYFQQSEQFNAAHYGIFAALLTAGTLLGLLTLSVAKIKPHSKFKFFTLSVIVFVIARSSVFIWDNLIPMLIFAFFFGYSVAILNSFINTSMQLITPRDKRGKVFGFLGALSGGLTPIGMAIGGVLGEFFAIKEIVFYSGAITLIGFLPILFNKEIRKYINFDPEEYNKEDELDNSITEADEEQGSDE